MSMKKSSYNIGNRTRNLPGCGAGPQPLRHRVPLFNRIASTKTYRQNFMIPDASSTKFLTILVRKFEETSL
jgi:hypothetical protein